jgi:uncharacterized protein (TIGR00730 family)
MARGIVSVFGGAAPKPGTPAYQEAYTLGRRLAEAGYTVMTGGYSGTMEAASKGAKAAGGHVIGVTVGLFEDQYGLSPNPYVDEVVRYDALHERMHHLVTHGEATVALRGGVGTFSEVALTWSLLQVRQIALRPLVLVGEGWEKTFAAYQAASYVSDRDMALLRFVPTAEDVVPALEAWFDTPPRVAPRLSSRADE